MIIILMIAILIKINYDISNTFKKVGKFILWSISPNHNFRLFASATFLPTDCYPMLRDITTTSAKVNSDIIPCILYHNKSQKSKSDQRRVQFDADGMIPPWAMLTVAMRREKRQQKRAKVAGTSTPKKSNPPKPEIGSSSTWNHDELETFKVHPAKEVEVKDIVPEKWFDFGNVTRYQSSISSLFFQLILARNKLVSVQPDDLRDSDVILEKSGWFNFAFGTLQDLEDLKTPDSRIDSLAEKRHEKHARRVLSMPPPVSQQPARRVGPSPDADPEAEEETTRVASISDPDKSSAGSKVFHACREEATQDLGNEFCYGAMRSLFRDKAPLNWVTGRPESPVLRWRKE